MVERLGAALKTCDGLKAISYSKNNLGIDDFVTTDSEFDDDSFSQESSHFSRNRAMCPLDQKCMTDSITEMTKTKHFMERLCLSHCHIHDRGMKILAAELDSTRIRYLNIGWCRLTAASVPDLCRFIKYNRSLEKCLMQHNEHGDPKSIKQIAQAITDHPALKYLDISANKVGSESFCHLLQLQAWDKIKLENLQCRKNNINGEEIRGIFKKLLLNSNLRVLNL